MAMLPDKAAFQERLGALPLTTYKAGETILTAGSKTGLLLILKSGKVAVIKDQVKIAEIAESGALFGELSALLNQPHAADVYALEASQFHVTGAEALLKEDPVALLHVATVLARRLDGANQAVFELKSQLQAGQPRCEIGQTIKKIETLLSPGTGPQDGR
jgi:CRP/FNR family cyclic AMP-dependent transcriptional regulator